MSDSKKTSGDFNAFNAMMGPVDTIERGVTQTPIKAMSFDEIKELLGGESNKDSRDFIDSVMEYHSMPATDPVLDQVEVPQKPPVKVFFQVDDQELKDPFEALLDAKAEYLKGLKWFRGEQAQIKILQDLLQFSIDDHHRARSKHFRSRVLIWFSLGMSFLALAMALALTLDKLM